MDQCSTCVYALGARRRCIGAVLLSRNGSALSARLWRCAHSFARADYDWSSAPGGGRYLRTLRVVAESRSVESLRAWAHEICLRGRGHARAPVSAYSTDNALVVHRVYRALLAVGGDVDRILRCVD